ncbi:MAG: hypothetical protein ACW99L_16895, partial [Promethearchaeota archaeon]
MMSGLKTLEKIYTEIEHNKLSINEGISIIISFIESSESDEVELKAKEILNKLSRNYKETYHILKNILEIDKKAIIRFIVAREMLNIYEGTSENILENQIQQDDSAIFLIELFHFLRTTKSRSSEILKNSLIAKYSGIYNVTSNEVVFFIDLESTQINSKKDLDINIGYFKKFKAPDIKTLRKGKLHNYVLKNYHIIALDLTRWEFYEIPKSIGLLSELKYLNLANLQLNYLPESMDNISKLEYLNLNGNNLTILPIWLIEFSNNKLSETYIEKGVFSDDATVLGILEVLSGEKFEKAQQVDDILTRETAFHYKINENGRVIGV